jgi:hypothetical protein
MYTYKILYTEPRVAISQLAFAMRTARGKTLQLFVKEIPRHMRKHWTVYIVRPTPRLSFKTNSPAGLT